MIKSCVTVNCRFPDYRVAIHVLTSSESDISCANGSLASAAGGIGDSDHISSIDVGESEAGCSKGISTKEKDPREIKDDNGMLLCSRTESYRYMCVVI